MGVNIQRPIRFINDCNCIVDCDELEKAIFWYQDRPTASIKHIYLHNGYPTITIRKDKIAVHRLLYMYWTNAKLDSLEWVHHIDENKLNASRNNLNMMNASEHQSHHAKGRPLTQSQRDAIIRTNKKKKIKRRDKRGRILPNEGVIDSE
jgi:hypothetical protein